jgi:hypothetical protein
MKAHWTEIKGKTFVVKTRRDFIAKVSRRKSMLLLVLTRYRMPLTVRPGGREYSSYCPFAHAWSPDHELHLSIRKGEWNCAACGKHGGAVEFLAYKESIPHEVAAVLICLWFGNH